MTVDTRSSAEQPNKLHANTIGLPGVLFQSITTMAPASAAAFTLAPAFGVAGVTLPFVVIIALVGCSFIALSMASLAKYMPSAGGFYTYVSRALGVQTGWITGWLFTLAYLLVVPFQLLVLGPVADQFAGTYLNLHFGWVAWAVIFTVLIFGFSYFGIKIASSASVVLGVLEITIFAVVSVLLIFTGGNNNTLNVFNPAANGTAFGGWQGIFLGLLFVFLAFAGFESSAPLAEETLNPRRNVPRAMVLAAVGIGVFYLLCSYAAVVGWGQGNLASLATDADPWGKMAGRFGGFFQAAVLFAILNSALANANAGVNAVTRVLFAMGRTNTFPSFFARLNRFGTPEVAVIVTMIVAIGVTLATGLPLGPFPGAFAFVGTVLTFPIIIVYILTCISVPVFYRREHPEEYNVWRHVVIPIIPVVILLAVTIFQFYPAFPPAPNSYAGPIVIAWLVIGIAIVVWLSRSAPELLKKSDQIYVDGD